MQFKMFVAATAAIATAEAGYVGFNYASTNTDGSARQQSDFESEFNRAKSLAGTTGADDQFTSARLYTMIQSGTTDTPISAIQAAIDTETSLLLGLWASAGQADFDNEISALKSAISTYGSSLTDLIVGISVGSEDLYRISPTGIENDSGAGASPDTLVSYIKQTKAAIEGTSASSASIGHVDTWNAWTNSSNDAVLSAVDWLGVDEYPYYQNQSGSNDVSDAKSLFYSAYDAVQDISQGKDVWVTETGWPVSGPSYGEAVASTGNAEIYWQTVACPLIASGTNTWWYILQDAPASPSFGIIGSDLDSAPLYKLQCSNSTTNSTTSSTSSSLSTFGTATGTGATGVTPGGTGSPYPTAGAPYPTAGASGYGAGGVNSTATGSGSAVASGPTATSSSVYTGAASTLNIAGVFIGTGAFAALFL